MTGYDAQKGELLNTADDIYAVGVTDGKAAQQVADQAAIDALNTTISTLQAGDVVDEKTIADLTAQVAALQAELDAQNPPPPPPPPPNKAALGVSVDVALPDTSQTSGAVRFYQTALNSKVTAVLDKGTRVIVWSTKDATPAAFKASIVAAQKKYAGLVVCATVNHEPDDDITKAHTMTVAQYVAKLNAFGQALKGMADVHFGPIHNGSFGKAVWQADEVGADKSLWTYWGMDRYNDGYADPATQFAEGAAYAKSLGLPLVIGECGAAPSNAAAQLKLAGQIRAWALDPVNNVAVVCWWVGSGFAFANASVQHALLGN